MLTAKENFIQCIEGGTPDRVVNNYEAIKLLMNPFAMFHNPRPQFPGDTPRKNAWGVLYEYPEGVPASFPVHKPDTIVIQDIEHWQDYVHAPSLDFPEEEWDKVKEMYDAVDTTKAFKCAFIAPGVFEQCHHLGEIANTCMNLAEYPDEMEDLIKYITEWELKLAEKICDKLHPEMLFHHDDWGSQKSTFMSVGMFEDFFVEPYKQIYGYYHDHGVKYVVHHSDSYAATLVPDMIEMGINVWQGCFTTNHIDELIAKYGDKISFMGGIENMLVDHEGWTDQEIDDVVARTVEKYGMKHFIPCIAQGGPGSTWPGVYQSLIRSVDEYNCKHFGFTMEELENARIPGAAGVMFGSKK